MKILLIVLAVIITIIYVIVQWRKQSKLDKEWSDYYASQRENKNPRSTDGNWENRKRNLFDDISRM